MATSEKIELKGASKYKADLKAIANESKSLAADMKLMASGFSDSSKQSETLQKQIQTQKKYIDTLVKAIDEEVKANGENSSSVIKLKENLAKAQEALNKMEKGTEDVTDAEKDATSQTLSFGDVLKANVIGDAIVGGVKALASAVKDVANNIKEAYNASVTWADDLETLSTVTGLSTETLQEFEYMAGLLDTDTDTITGALTRLTKNMNTARKGTGDAKDAFEQLNIAITDENGKLRDNEEVFNEIITAFQGMEEGADRDALAMTLFGKSAQDLNPLIAAGAEKIEALRKEAHDLGYVLDEDALGALTASADATDRFNNTVDMLKRTLSVKLAPAITKLLDAVRQILSGELSLGDFINNLVSSIKTNMPKIIQGGKELLNGIVQGLVGNTAGITQCALELIMGLVTGLTEALPILIANLPMIIREIVRTIGNNIPALVQAGFGLIVGLGEGMFGALLNVGKVLLNNIKVDIVQPVKEIATDFLEAGKNLVIGLWNGISDKMQWIKDKIKTWVGNVLAYFKNLLGIHSPSKEMQWMGEMMAQGLANGISSNLGIVNNAWGSLGVNGGLTAPTAYGGSVVNIYPQQLTDSTIDYIYQRFNDRMGAMA